MDAMSGVMGGSYKLQRTFRIATIGHANKFHLHKVIKTFMRLSCVAGLRDLHRGTSVVKISDRAACDSRISA